MTAGMIIAEEIRIIMEGTVVRQAETRVIVRVVAQVIAGGDHHPLYYDWSNSYNFNGWYSGFAFL